MSRTKYKKQKSLLQQVLNTSEKSLLARSNGMEHIFSYCYLKQFIMHVHIPQLINSIIHFHGILHPAGFIREGRLGRVNLASLVFQSMGSTIVDKVKKLSIFAGFIQRFSKFHGFYGTFGTHPNDNPANLPRNNYQIPFKIGLELLAFN